MPRLPRSLTPLAMYGQHFLARFIRPMTMGVRGVVIDAEDRVLLVRHSYVAGWHLPGGGVEAGEPLICSLERELAEEGAIEVTGVPALHGIFYNDRYSRRDHVAVYVVRDFRITGERKPDWEIVETGFFPTASLPEQTVRASRERIAEVMAGSAPAERW